MSSLLVNIDVGDLERAVEFYCAAFDLRRGRRFEGAAELLGAATTVETEVQAHAWAHSRCSPIRSATASACSSSPAAATTQLQDD